MKKMLTTLAAVLCCAAVFTSCNDDITPPGYKDLGGTWVSDISGNTFSIWNYGKSWNVWTFDADGTGVCDVFFLAGEDPVAIQHQPFTYTAEDGKLITQMDDCSREWTYRTEGGRLTITHEGGSEITFDKAILQRADISWSVQHLDRYSLSVCLYKQTVYNFDYIGAGANFKSNIGAGYEQCTFHQLTGWGNFLRINNGLPWGNPTSGDGEPIE